MKSIGEWAFADNELTTVTIPSSVESISEGAFMANKLEQVILNEGLVTIGDRAFAHNMIHSATVPSTLTSQLHNYNSGSGDSPVSTCGVFGGQGAAFKRLIDEVPARRYLDFFPIEESSPEEQTIIQNAINESWFVAIYTTDSANPQGFTDFADIATFSNLHYDPSVSQRFLLGGQLINPSQAVLEYVNSRNSALKQSITITGENDGAQLTDYLSSSLLQNFPYPEYAGAITEAEEATMQAFLRSVFFRSGDTVNIIVPEIAGYVAPTPSHQTMTVLGASTVKTLIYLTPEEAAAATLSNTGSNVAWIILGSVLLSAAGIVVAGHTLTLRSAYGRNL